MGVTRPEPVAPADLVAQARTWPEEALVNDLADALEAITTERDDWRDTAAEAIRKRDEILRRQVTLAADRDRLAARVEELKDGLRLHLCFGRSHLYFEWCRPRDWLAPVIPFLVETERTLSRRAYGLGVWMERT